MHKQTFKVTELPDNMNGDTIIMSDRFSNELFNEYSTFSQLRKNIELRPVIPLSGIESAFSIYLRLLDNLIKSPVIEAYKFKAAKHLTLSMFYSTVFYLHDIEEVKPTDSQSIIMSRFEKELKFIIPPETPFVGRSFNATRAGIHADGLLKDEEIYNIFDTKAILNRPARVSINNASGLAGVAYWINDFYGLPEGSRVQKDDPLVARVKAMIDEEYRQGRCTVYGDSELDGMVRLADPQRHKEFYILGE